MTIFQHTLPTLGPGSLTPREVAKPTAKDLNPSTDFYKKIALDCSGQYIAVDLFLTGSTFTDIASVSCVSKYSGGCVYRCHRLEESGRLGYLESCFVRYLNRKIGFEVIILFYKF
jgi:protein transport protein SEC24